MSERERRGRDEVPELDKFHEIELEKVLDAVVSIENRRAQVDIFFGTVNLGALGIALTTQKSVVLFFAGVLLWILLVVDLGGRVSLSGYFYQAMKLQAKFAPDDEDFLRMFSSSATAWARGSADMSKEERHVHTPGHRLPLSLRSLRTQSITGFWLPLAASFIEIAAGFVTWLVFGWSVI